MNEDVFDKIMKLPGLRILYPFYRQHKEVLLYLFFGGCAFIISIGSYALANVRLGVNELIANIISWILAVVFSFFTNRVWVFQSETHTIKKFWAQFTGFLSGRVATFVVEEAIIFVFITLMDLNSVAVKLVAQVVVIVLNYVISKFWVFKKSS